MYVTSSCVYMSNQTCVTSSYECVTSSYECVASSYECVTPSPARCSSFARSQFANCYATTGEYDDVTHSYDDVTHSYDDVTHSYDDAGERSGKREARRDYVTLSSTGKNSIYIYI